MEVTEVTEVVTVEASAMAPSEDQSLQVSIPREEEHQQVMPPPEYEVVPPPPEPEEAQPQAAEPQAEQEEPPQPPLDELKVDTASFDATKAPGTPTGPKRGREGGEEKDGEKKWAGWPGDNVFRLVVPVQKVGGIIGRKGEFVKKMCEETRSRIKILEGVPGTAERIVSSLLYNPRTVMNHTCSNNSHCFGFAKLRERGVCELQSSSKSSAFKLGLEFCVYLLLSTKRP